MFTDEQAKATQEVAKASQAAIEAIRDVSRYFGRFAEGPLEQAAGMLEDRLRFMRFEQAVRFQKRAIELMEESGLEKATRPVPLNFIVPVLEAASLEEDDNLQEVWAKLLVNAVDAESTSTPRHAYISMLKDMTPFDAQLLRVIVKHRTHFEASVATELASKYFGIDADYEREAQVSLYNLQRLNCVNVPMGWGGERVAPIEAVTPTELAFSFVEACTLRADKFVQS